MLSIAKNKKILKFKKYKLFYPILIFLFFLNNNAIAELTFAEKNSGKIFLQVENNGEAWYVDPANLKRHYLGRPQNAFDIMRNLGIGITNEDLEKIPLGIILSKNKKDSDDDGIDDELELVIGTDPQKADTDEDGYNDKTEIDNNYNPLGAGKLNIDKNFSKKNSGKIFLQVENNGEAWYVNPKDLKKYYLGRPQNAFDIMRNLGIGITNEDLNKIAKEEPSYKINNYDFTQNNYNDDDTMENAAEAIYSSDKEKIKAVFTAQAASLAYYTSIYLDQEGKESLYYIIKNAKLESSSEKERIYSLNVYFPLGGYYTKVNFHVLKQDDGTWKLNNI